MNLTIKTFLDILGLRAGPEDLPTSPRLLIGLFVLLIALQTSLGAWLLPQEGALLPQALLSGLVSLGWLALVLRLFGKPERFVQTASAVLGIACAFAPIAIPVLATARPDSGTPVTVTPMTFLAFLISLYLIYVNGRILRAAIERPLFQCIVLFLLGEFFVFALTIALGLGSPNA